MILDTSNFYSRLRFRLETNRGNVSIPLGQILILGHVLGNLLHVFSIASMYR
jgi:hypothetical protein